MSSRNKRRKFYAVRLGRCPGIYHDWNTARQQVNGFPGAIFKSFGLLDEAMAFMAGGEGMTQKKVPRASTSAPKAEVKRNITPRHSPPTRTTPPSSTFRHGIIDLSMESDGESVVDLTLDDVSEPSRSVPTTPAQTKAKSTSQTAMTEFRPASSMLNSTFPHISLDAGLSSPEVPESLMDLDSKLYEQRPQPRYGRPEPVFSRAGQTQHQTDPPLSPQQQAVVDRALKGHSLFFTGSAGTGKSVLLRALIRALEPRGGVAIAASTGMAALNIGGCTLHSWAGVGLGEGTVEYLLNMIRKSRALRRWLVASVLVVDEDFLDKLDEIGRKLRNSPKPFGGIQVIFSGDFFQLPPVAKGGKRVSYAFDSNVWDRLFPRSNFVTLERVFRQRDDTFVECLESMRRGVVRTEHDSLLHSLDRRLDTKDGIEPVILYSKRVDVERENMSRLRVIDSPYVHYDAQDKGGITAKGRPVSDVDATDLLNDRSRWPQFLPLKVGAQVMLVMIGLVNGSTGIVVAFKTVQEALADPDIHVLEEAGEAPATLDPKREWPVVKFKAHPNVTWPLVLIPRMSIEIKNADHNIEATRWQVPLILAWAITIHKSQGLTLEKVRVDLSGAFDCGQAYVALSRATSLDGLEVKGIMTSERVLKWAQEMEEDKEWDELLADADFVNDY